MSGTAVQKTSGLRAELVKYEPSFAKLLPAGYPPSRLTTGAMLSVQRNPALAKCTPMSIAISCAQVAQWGLDLGITAHLVPYGNECTAIADYKGYIELMLRNRLIAGVDSGVVYDGDEFAYELGLDKKLRHVPHGPRKDRTVLGAYAIVRLKSGDPIIEVMEAPDIDAIRQKHSKQWKSGPLPGWYARKTVIRQVAKYAPKTPELSRLIDTDDESVEIRPATLAELEDFRREEHAAQRIRAVSEAGYDDAALDRELAAEEAPDAAA